MRKTWRRRILPTAGLAVGCGAAWLLAERLSGAEFAAALERMGILGLLGICLLHVIFPLAACAQGWRAALSSILGRDTGFRAMFLCRWVRDSTNQLIGFVPLAGEAAGGRLAVSLCKAEWPQSTAGLIGDVRAEISSQAAFCALGALAWISVVGGGSEASAGRAGTDSLWLFGGLGAVGFMAAGLWGFVRFGGIAFLERAAEKTIGIEPGNGAGVAKALEEGRRNGGAWPSFLWHLAGWLGSAAEAWAGLSLLGADVDFKVALALEAAVYAGRNAAFFVPGAVGVQEGIYAACGAALGLPMEIAAAFSVVKRGREALLGVGGLLMGWRLGTSRKGTTTA